MLKTHDAGILHHKISPRRRSPEGDDYLMKSIEKSMQDRYTMRQQDGVYLTGEWKIQ